MKTLQTFKEFVNENIVNEKMSFTEIKDKYLDNPYGIGADVIEYIEGINGNSSMLIFRSDNKYDRDQIKSKLKELGIPSKKMRKSVVDKSFKYRYELVMYENEEMKSQLVNNDESLDKATSDTVLYKVYFKPEYSLDDDSTNTPIKPVFVQMNTGERTKIAKYTAIEKISGYGKTTPDKLLAKDYMGTSEMSFADLFKMVKRLLKVKKQRTEIKDEFNKVLNKIQKDYNELKSIADALRIEIAMPRLYINDKKIHMKVREPRQYRHPDEYSIDVTVSDKYHKFQSKLDKIMDMLDAFVSKRNLKLEISADWI